MLAAFFSILLSNRTREAANQQAIAKTVSLIAEPLSVIIAHEPRLFTRVRHETAEMPRETGARSREGGRHTGNSMLTTERRAHPPPGLS